MEKLYIGLCNSSIHQQQYIGSETQMKECVSATKVVSSIRCRNPRGAWQFVSKTTIERMKSNINHIVYERMIIRCWWLGLKIYFIVQLLCNSLQSEETMKI